MEIYIEYAFLQNFILDGALIWLSCQATKTPLHRGRWAFSALFGAVFAIVYPLLRLPSLLGMVLKISAGLLLCLLAVGSLKRKKEWNRYALFTACFFALSFLFGGALNGVTQGSNTKGVREVLTPLGFAVLSIFCVCLFGKLYKKRTVWRCMYDCAITNGAKAIQLQGFFDSGNTATKRGVPICFVSPEIVYELWGDETLFSDKGTGQVCDEVCITTISGAKKVCVYKGGLEIKIDGKVRKIKEVYFAPSRNIISREYSMILHSRIFDEGEEL